MLYNILLCYSLFIMINMMYLFLRYVITTYYVL